MNITLTERPFSPRKEVDIFLNLTSIYLFIFFLSISFSYKARFMLSSVLTNLVGYILVHPFDTICRNQSSISDQLCQINGSSVNRANKTLGDNKSLTWCWGHECPQHSQQVLQTCLSSRCSTTQVSGEGALIPQRYQLIFLGQKMTKAIFHHQKGLVSWIVQVISRQWIQGVDLNSP